MVQSSFYSDTPNYATDFPTQNDSNTNPVDGNPTAPSSFYPDGGIYEALANSDTTLAQMQAYYAATHADKLAADDAAASAAASDASAATHDTNAAASASTASTQAGTATTQAGIATTQAGIATTKAGQAATSATNAATSETNASTSATNAATSATNAANSLFTFKAQWLGAQASNPTLDGNGNAVNAGDLYFNTTANELRIYNGTSWFAYSSPIVTSVFGRTGAVVAAANDYTFAQIGSKPTSISGYGITDTLTNTVFGRSGTVTAQTGDYTFAQIGSKPTTVAGYGITDAAPINSPGFTGTPTAPTPTAGDNSTNIATTAFITTALSSFTVGRPLASGPTTWYVAKTGSDSNTGKPSGITGTITFTNGSANIGWTAHGRSVGDVFVYTNSGGAAPTNFVSGRLYYVKTVVDANTITVAVTSGGTAVSAASAGSGTHTATHVSPFLTVQKALDAVGAMDMSIYNALILVAGGQYDQALTTKPQVGGASYTLKGDTTTPANVILTNNAAGWGTFYVPGPGPQGWSIQGFRITASGSNSGAIFGFNGAVINYSNIEFGACGNYHIWLNNGSFASMTGNCNVVATGTSIHWLMQQGSRMDTRGMTLTLTGTPAFATTFCQMNDICDILCSGMTFSGAATGSRFVMAGNSVINSAGAAEASYFPGNVAGTKPTGSLWI